MKAHHLLVALLFIPFAIACNKEPSNNIQEPAELHLTQKASEVINHSNAFGVDLFAAVAQEDEASNVLLSPLSASVALTMLLDGCRNETYDQIKETLGYNGMTEDEINQAYHSLVGQLLTVDPKVNLALANAVWCRQDYPIKSAYKESMKNNFDAQVQNLDFSNPQAIETINDWASDNTNGKIDKVLEEIDPDAVMFLMNALYFKGEWSNRFDAGATSPAPFYLDDGTTISVPMMQGDIKAKTMGENGYFAVELCYGRTNFSMIIVLSSATMSEFLQSFDAETWNTITSMLDDQSQTYEVTVSLPKFSFKYEKMLTEELKAMGMPDAFDKLNADLSGISDNQLYVDFVKQNTYIKVNEEGTEAAAVTTVGVNELTAQGNFFTVDKPFVFAIRERTTNTLLFIGKVMNPLEE